MDIWFFLAIILGLIVSILAIFSRIVERKKIMAREMGEFSVDDFEIIEYYTDIHE
jgi:hypothetical protein